MNAYEKLLAVQQELKAPKGQFNSFGKYKYRSCEDILEAVKPLLGKYKAALTISDHIELIGDRHYVIATVNFVDTESGDIIPATAQAREEESKKGMDSSQVTGAASSYARKYALNGLFCIDDTKDSDTTNNGALPPGPDCEVCGEEIMPFNNGKVRLTGHEFAEQSRKAYGMALCRKCAEKAKAERENPA